MLAFRRENESFVQVCCIESVSFYVGKRRIFLQMSDAREIFRLVEQSTISFSSNALTVTAIAFASGMFNVRYLIFVGTR